VDTTRTKEQLIAWLQQTMATFPNANDVRTAIIKEIITLVLTPADELSVQMTSASTR